MNALILAVLCQLPPAPAPPQRLQDAPESPQIALPTLNIYLEDPPSVSRAEGLKEAQRFSDMVLFALSNRVIEERNEKYKLYNTSLNELRQKLLKTCRIRVQRRGEAEIPSSVVCPAWHWSRFQDPLPLPSAVLPHDVLSFLIRCGLLLEQARSAQNSYIASDWILGRKPKVYYADNYGYAEESENINNACNLLSHWVRGLNSETHIFHGLYNDKIHYTIDHLRSRIQFQDLPDPPRIIDRVAIVAMQDEQGKTIETWWYYTIYPSFSEIVEYLRAIDGGTTILEDDIRLILEWTAEAR